MHVVKFLGMQFGDEIEGEEEYMSGSGEEEDEMANFIVDEENTIYENRAPIRYMLCP